ncbi:MAG: RDD family protein [Gammaproteobacteria bacterium]|nr:RDD family protein [Gammaproteobacteria bacterium]
MRFAALPALLRRLAALCYDLLVLTGVVMATSFGVVVSRAGEAVPAGERWFQALVLAQAAAYFIGFWSAGGQTPGMRTWKLRVVSLDGTLKPGRAVVRLVAAIATNAPAGAGLLWMLASRDGRALHDRLSGTIVVRAEGR